MKLSTTILNSATDNKPEAPVALQIKQRNNPLHGLTLKTIVTALVAHFNWAELAERVPVRCFSHDPSIGSSLKFLRKTPWARKKVEGLYIFMLRDINRHKNDMLPESVHLAKFVDL